MGSTTPNNSTPRRVPRPSTIAQRHIGEDAALLLDSWLDSKNFDYRQSVDPYLLGDAAARFAPRLMAQIIEKHDLLRSQSRERFEVAARALPHIYGGDVARNMLASRTPPAGDRQPRFLDGEQARQGRSQRRLAVEDALAGFLRSGFATTHEAMSAFLQMDQRIAHYLYDHRGLLQQMRSSPSAPMCELASMVRDKYLERWEPLGWRVVNGGVPLHARTAQRGVANVILFYANIDPDGLREDPRREAMLRWTPIPEYGGQNVGALAALQALEFPGLVTVARKYAQGFLDRGWNDMRGRFGDVIAMPTSARFRRNDELAHAVAILDQDDDGETELLLHTVAQEADTEESGTVLYDDLDAGRLSTPHFDVMVACDPLLSPAFRYRAMTRWEEAYVNVAPRLEGSDCELSI